MKRKAMLLEKRLGLVKLLNFISKIINWVRKNPDLCWPNPHSLSRPQPPLHFYSSLLFSFKDLVFVGKEGLVLQGNQVKVKQTKMGRFRQRL